jgi:threonine 3-dehydrogenase
MNLVTGGRGFVGSWLAKILLEEDSEVKTFSRSMSRQHPFLSSFGSKWTHVSGTLERMSDVLGAVKESRPDIIYHLGGMLSIPSEQNPQASFGTNVVGIFNVLEAARLFDVRTVVYASTNGTYGLGLEGLKTINDQTLQRPFTIYGCGKVCGELLGRYYHRKYGIDFRSVRLPAVVGPGSKTKHVSIYSAWAIEKSALGEPYEIFVTPETACPVVYFKDAAQAFRDIARVPQERIKTMNYNIVGVRPIPTAEKLKEIILRFLPQAQLSFKPDPLAMAYQKMHQGVEWDETPAATEWDWKPTYTLEGVVEDFIQELKEHRDWYM